MVKTVTRRGRMVTRTSYGTPGMDTIDIRINDPLATKIRELHAISSVGESVGDRTSIQKWCIEIIENFIVDNRKERLL